MTPKYKVVVLEDTPTSARLEIVPVKESRRKRSNASDIRIWGSIVIVVALMMSFVVGYFQDMELIAIEKSYESELKMGEEF